MTFKLIIWFTFTLIGFSTKLFSFENEDPKYWVEAGYTILKESIDETSYKFGISYSDKGIIYSVQFYESYIEKKAKNGFYWTPVKKFNNSEISALIGLIFKKNKSLFSAQLGVGYLTNKLYYIQSTRVDSDGFLKNPIKNQYLTIPVLLNFTFIPQNWYGINIFGQMS